MTEAMLDVRDLRVGMEKSACDIVSEISFLLAPGRLLGLVGESGSGKTTVALAALAYARRGLRIEGGEVRLAGHNLLTDSDDQLNKVRGRDVGYVAQDPGSALNPALTIGRQLHEVAKAHVTDDKQEAAKLIRETLQEARIQDVSRALACYPHQLSGGQQQRVMLAMAFVCRPKVIVLDEPTTGLDVTTQSHVLDTVRNLCALHSTAGIYVSHDLAVVSTLVDHVAVMYGGRLVEYGATAELFGDPAHPYTRLLLEAVPSLTGNELPVGIKGQPPRPTDRPPGCPFAPRCPLKIEICERVMPSFTERGSTHTVRCHRAGDDLPDKPLELRPRAAEAAAATGASIALTASGVRASYGGAQVLHGIDFDLHAGECLAIVGESGSGKTTLARCIGGAHGAWSGEISFEGERLAREARERTAEQSRRIQYIFQNPYSSLNPRRTIGEILDQPIERFTTLSGADRRDAAARALEDVALSARFLDRYPNELSGGERQRVAIARALVVNPTLILCDEVTSALDVSVQASVVTLLRELQRERSLSLLFITHNLALVRAVAERVAVVANGSVCEIGGVEQVLASPQHEYTQRLLRDVPRLRRFPTGAVSG